MYQSPYNIWQNKFQQPQQVMPQLAAPQVLQPMPQAAPQGDPWAAKAALEAQHAQAPAPAPAAPVASAQPWWAQNPAFGEAIQRMMQGFGGMRPPAPMPSAPAPAPAPPLDVAAPVDPGGAMAAPPAMSPASAAHLQRAGSFGRTPWAQSFGATPASSPNWGRSPWAQAAIDRSHANTSYSMAPAPVAPAADPMAPKAFARGGLACKPMKQGGVVDRRMIESISSRPTVDRTPAERAAVQRGNRSQALEVADEGVLPPRMRRPAPVAKACGGLAVVRKRK